MNLSEIFENRRSIRRYDDTPIDAEILSEILKIGLLSPTGNNLKTVDFILIQDKTTIIEIAEIRKIGTGLFKTAGAAILVIADSSKSNLWIEDASIAMAYMHLASDAMGLGSCWVQMRTREDVNGENLETVLQKKFDIPNHMKPLAILALGNIENHPKNIKPRDVDWQKVHNEKY